MINNEIFVHNTLTHRKEKFEPHHPPFVGMYVCGPTVYGDAHLGHARPYVTFDVVTRYLRYIGYKVRYVRNITDVGHLENDADEGEDKIAKKARLEQLEPMEVVQYFTTRFHKNMEQLNILPPSIEPRASGHIIEQINMVQELLKNGYAYEVNGSVYFDVVKYNSLHHYGELSGRVLDELLSETRELEGQHEKHNKADFALWKRAEPVHILRWPSPWGDGFPGWHLECSVMSTKYLGKPFDIHGGGMDLLFPHHECEIAQSIGEGGKQPVKYWLHNNMVTINGQKMGKSLGNFITLNELFSGNHPLLTRAFSPMTIRFFNLQAHYRSTLDFSNEALSASEKGLRRLLHAAKILETLKSSSKSTLKIQPMYDNCMEAMNDDFNTPIALANLFEGVRFIHLIEEGKELLNEQDLALLKKTFNDFVFGIFGLIDEDTGKGDSLVSGLMDLILGMRSDAKQHRDFASSDKIREELGKLHISLMDGKEGTKWGFAAPE